MSEVESTSWRSLLASARDKADELSKDPRAQTALSKARKGAAVASRHLDSTRRRVTQEEAWAETVQSLQEIVDVLVVQQRLIEGLSQELAELRATVGPSDG